MLTLLNFTPFDIFLLWICAVSLSWFVYSFFELRKTHKKIKHLKDHEDKRWREIEEKAQKDYQEILQTANKKAEEIIQNATRVSFDVSTSLKQAVNQAIDEHKSELETTSLTLTNKYAGELEEINKHNLELLTNVYKDIEIDAKSNFEKYQQALEQQTFDAERQAKTRIEEQYQELEQELTTVKQEKISQMNESIKKVIQDISKDVIGRSLEGSDQETLITQALETAKKEGVI